MKMNVSEATLAMLASAEGVASLAARLGVSAVMALIEENLGVTFKHGDAVQLATLLVNGGISKASGKRYADITVMACKAIAHQASLASSKAKPAEKASVRLASQQASLAELAGMRDMRDIRAWAKDHGIKAKEPETAPETAPAPAPETAPETAPATVEATGQLREIKETLAMLNAGQLTQSDALSTIAEIVGIAIAKPTKPVIKPVVKTGT